MKRVLQLVLVPCFALLGFVPAAFAQGTFAATDRNGDSYLDADELAEWVDDEGIYTRWDVDADTELDADDLNEGIFILWDLDDDDFVNEAEWTIVVDDWLDEARTFAEWDENGDSKLDAEEIGEGLQRTDLHETWSGDDDVLDSDEFVSAYVDLWDYDEDDRIDIVEFDRALDYYVF